MSERAACVRFEIEYVDGRVLRVVGPGAERHHRDLDAACSLASVHGWSPAAPPEFEVFGCGVCKYAGGCAIQPAVCCPRFERGEQP